jgi:hypothetical protein
MMRLAITAMAALLASGFAGNSAKAADWPWCAEYTGEGGASNCGFASWQQCQLNISGIGGFCHPNPVLRFEEPRGRRRS